MAKIGWILPNVFIVIVASSTVFSAYAEVTSLQTNQSLYTHGNKIYFTGTVGISDYQKLVNLVIHDPTGKFVLISGNYSDPTYTFEIVVDTNNTDQFYTKGTYAATAFTGKEPEGKIISFDFLPDGSPVIHHLPQNTNSTEIINSNQLGQHYQTQLSENIGVGDVTENITKVAIPASAYPEKSSNQYDFKNILYPIISLCGAGIVAAILYGRKRNSRTGRQEPEKTQPLSSTIVIAEPEDDYAIMILKNRLAKGEITIEEFKAIKDALAEP